MKRGTAVILSILSIILLASCAQKNGGSAMPKGADPADQEIKRIFETVCSADEALALSRKSNAVVFETRGCTSGKETWDAFYRTAMSGSPAAVLCAYYYTLDKERVSEELYEKEKDEYPKLFFSLVEYDGKEYSVKSRESTAEALDDQETFRYLLHFTGDAPATALYSSYDNYVLADDPEATMEGIWEGLVSAQAGAGCKHCTVYRDCLGWKG